MADQIEVYEVVHTMPGINTVLDYILDPNSPAFQYKDDPDAFLLVKNKQGFTNRKIIEGTYRTASEQKYIGKTAKEMLLKINTPLAIEKQKANQAGLLTEGLEVVSYDVNAFKARMLAALESKEGYAAVDELKPIEGKRMKGVAKQMYPDLSVWVWCRSLASDQNNYEGEILNLTPFIENIDTNISKDGGNFDLNLPPLVCEKNADGKWSIRKNSIQFYKTGKKVSQQGDGYVASDSLYQLDGNREAVRNAFLFHTILNTNDLVFIRFETLKLEQVQRQTDDQFLFIPKTQLPDRIYDMIGLIDKNAIKIMPSGTNVSIRISGRDLSKLFIEDGTYFFNLEMNQGMLGGPGSATTNSGGLTQRLSYNNGLTYLNLYFNKTIDRVFKFVMNQLSSIKIVPNDLFSAYGDRRNTRFEEKRGGDRDVRVNQLNSLKDQAMKAIANLRIVNELTLPRPTDEKKMVEAIFNEHKRFQKAIRDAKVRQVSGGQTVGWLGFIYLNERGVQETIVEDSFSQYFNRNLYPVYQTRTVPEALPIVIPIDQIIDIENSKPNYQEGLQKNLAPGIWQIIKLVLDKTVLNRRIVDSSFSSANGSLMNFFRKVCQEPFVEYYGDTYGDMYHLVVRKPPIDRQGIKSILNAQVQTEDLVSTAVTDEGQVLRFTESRVTPLVVDIEAYDVIEESLSFDDSEAYSWYHFQPQAVFQGGANRFSLAYLPAVFLEEYAEIWGSKPFQISHNYLPLTQRDLDQTTLSVTEQQAVEDMRFIIESNAYLPFTRKGTLKLNGDRRMKIGNFVRYKPTGEIFKIDHVQQHASIDETSIERYTTISVSRGMVEQLIYGVPLADPISGEVVSYASYFNIVDTRPNYEYTNTTDYILQKTKIGQDDLSTPLKETLKVVNSNINSQTILLPNLNQNLHLLSKYSPEEKSRFIQLINAINQRGYGVIVNSTKRDYQKQYALYQATRNSSTGKAALPGHSSHEKGRSIDINLISPNKQVVTSQWGEASWLQTGIPQLAQILGFKWGGNAFKGNYDPVHFELLTDKTPAENIVQSLYQESKVAVPNKVLDITKVFNNIKVNKEVFNFFLKHNQFDKQYVTSNNLFLDLNSRGKVESTSSIVVTSTKR